VALVAFAAPAAAADLAARPYTKAPAPMIAAIYDWSGFYIGLNGGWGSSDKYTTFNIPTGLVVDKGNETRWGGVVGAGLEYGFAPNWSVGVEYDHMFMGTNNVTLTAPALIPALYPVERIGQGVDMATVRINYRWGGPIVARY